MNLLTIFLTAIILNNTLPREILIEQNNKEFIFQKEFKSEEIKSTYSEEIDLTEELQEYVFDVAEKYGLNPYLVFAMIERESTFKSDAVNYNGTCLGLMQISIKWHKERMERLGCDDLFDPYQNILVGCDYIAELIEQVNSEAYALMLYNMNHKDATKMYESGKISKYAEQIINRAEEIEQLY